MVRKYKFSILVAFVILYLSLANSHTFDKVPAFNIPYFDKVVHFGMYFGLMLMILFESRRAIKDMRHLFLISLIPLSYGIIIELMQYSFTVTRSGSFYDALADFAGILTSIVIIILVKPLKNQIFREV